MTTPMGRNWLYYYLSVRKEYYDLMLPKRRYPDGKDIEATENAGGEGDMGMAGDTRDDKAGTRHQVGRPGPVRSRTVLKRSEHGQSFEEVPTDSDEGREDTPLRIEGQAEGYKDLAEHYRQALNDIRRHQGKVCQHYELCQHVSCRSSYTAWAIADFALRNA